MRRLTLLAALALVAVLATIGWAIPTFAQGSTGSQDQTPANGGWDDMVSYCHGSGGMMGGFHTGLTDAVTLERVAGTLGLTYEQLTARLAQGETIAQVAQAQGVSIETVVTTILAPQSEVLQVRVKYGYLSETQAQAILEQARLEVEQAIAVPSYGSYAPSGSPTTGYTTPGYGPGYGQGAWDGTGGMMGGSMMDGGMMGGGMMGW